MARPGNVGIQARRIALLVAGGVNGAEMRSIAERLTAEGAVAVFVAPTLGAIEAAGGEPLQADASLEVAPSVVFDAVVIGDAGAELAANGRAVEFVKDQYRHCKTILALGSGRELIAKAGIPERLASNQADRGLLFADNGTAARGLNAFVQAVAAHRHFARETDPPIV